MPWWIRRWCIYSMSANITRLVSIVPTHNYRNNEQIIFIQFVSILEQIITQPCSPSPCGPNSQCREINNQAVCSCIMGYVGSPPSCRPECTINADCYLTEACSNQKCKNPCLGTCGVGAKCQVINHKPICSCPPSMTGDPFVRCHTICEFT